MGTDGLAQRFLGRSEERPIDKLFRACVRLDGSDLHLKVGQPPYVRVAGTLRQVNRAPIDDEEMVQLCIPLLDRRNRELFDRDGAVDFAYSVDVDEEDWRFRVNMMQQLGHVGLVARKVNNFVPDFKALHLPETLDQLCNIDQGMVLISGVTGAGKTTTIASMLNWINNHHRKHILMLEDPIEFVFREDKCLITQREIGLDVTDFEIAMKHAVREDPDVMVVGEMRDRETFHTAIQAAETGHLVFGTIHASSAATTVGRLLSLFPETMHGSVRNAMALNMKGIITQKLVVSSREDIDRVPMVEVMNFNPTIRKLIIDEEDEKLGDAIRIGREDGMQDFTLSLLQLVEDELVDRKTALDVAPNKDALKMALKGIDVTQPGIL